MPRLTRDYLENLEADFSGFEDEIQEKLDAIDEKAGNRDSGEMTLKEEERYDSLSSIIDQIGFVVDSLQDLEGCLED